MKKENFNIKLKVHFLEERLAQLAPDQIDAALKQNINLKVEVQQRGVEMKKYKKLLLELQRELERLQNAKSREKDLEERLEDMERELLDLRRKKAGRGPIGDELRERNVNLEEENLNLKQEMEQLRAHLEESNAALQDLSSQHANGDSTMSGKRQPRQDDRIRALEADNEELRMQREEYAEALRERDEELDNLVDEREALKLELENLRRKNEDEVLQRSESRTQMYSELEDRQKMEDQLNKYRDQVAALHIQLSQKEDDLNECEQRVRDGAADYTQEVENVQADWMQEVEEWKQQVEELRDVRLSFLCSSSFTHTHIIGSC